MNSNRRIALLLACALPATATADEDAIERCRQASTPEARIACLEEALGGGASSKTDPVIPASAVPERPVPPAEALPPDVPETLPQVIVPLGDEDALDELTVDEVVEPEPEPPVEAAAPAPVPAADLGREQLPSTIAEREPGRAQGLEVARYEVIPFRRLEVHLANGQVWRQIKGDTQEVRASLRKNQTVDIEESTLGGYRLRLNEMRRTIRVRRVR